jgi:RNA polymerase sigma factor for flagellar operon FliA
LTRRCRYQPALGVPFDAFARRRIHGAMLDALRGLDWVPRSVRRLQRRAVDTIARLRHALGREPEAEEIAADLEIPVQAYDTCSTNCASPKSRSRARVTMTITPRA